MESIVVIGSAGHAKVVLDAVREAGRYRVEGVVDRRREVGETTMGYRVLGREEDLPALVSAHSIRGALIAIGDNFTRSEVASRIRRLCPELPFVTAVHPKAAIASDVSLGEGTVIMAGVVVNACAAVGRFCILNTGASLDHDSTLGDFASLAPRATTGGNCRIGDYAAIGIGAVLLQGVTIGEQTVVGASALVLRNIGPRVVAYGSPARVVRERQPGDRYL